MRVNHIIMWSKALWLEEKEKLIFKKGNRTLIFGGREHCGTKSKRQDWIFGWTYPRGNKSGGKMRWEISML